jgi:N-acetylmuramate 1-kinase
MSRPTQPPPQPPALAAQPAVSPAVQPAVAWADAAREAAFLDWIGVLAGEHQLALATLRPASADASFRRYLRLDREDGSGSAIVMDAPPEQENCRPFVEVARLMQKAGLRVPHILDWHERLGFMLLEDVGDQTLLEVLSPDHPTEALTYYRDATSSLLAWQGASRPGVLPAYDEALLMRELELFPHWYLGRHKGLEIDAKTREMLSATFRTLVQRNLAAPQVFVHRDFMPRNLMLPRGPYPVARQTGAPQTHLAVLDFQDAVYGPITYDMASLLRDAFLTWEEDFVLDVTIRYWEQARRLGLMDFDGWSEDFGAFYRAVEWMGLQRHLKVAGIFARLTLRDGKPKYLADAPRFIHYIRHAAVRYREFKPLLRLIDEVEGLQAASGFAYGRV